jgi:hypothetical protein
MLICKTPYFAELLLSIYCLLSFNTVILQYFPLPEYPHYVELLPRL